MRFCEKCETWRSGNDFSPGRNACKHCERARKNLERQLKYQLHPELKERDLRKQSDRRKTPEGRERHYELKKTEKHASKRRERARFRYANEPGYKERVLEITRASRRRDPIYKEKKRQESIKYKDHRMEYQNNRYKTDPQF